ncbi:tetratricopeptide repeat protein [Pseudanabaena sp. UWO310]|uniref:tetratricopeptide repeat protein n=1 Tax=Pseudanabaena sp. UWO310 TaxID=2480795 RepID=UPI0011609884|nr:hypothetical protein [Pseudanabaena sp. UWO310]TYQ24632.1 hypothetical protein PseudUWO310_20445 [Pseudanabaena sp. UWO310]
MKAVFIYAKTDEKYFEEIKKHLHVPSDRYGMKVISHEHPNTSYFENDINDADIVFLLVSVNSCSTPSWSKYADLAIKYKPKNSVIPIKIDDTSWIGKSFYDLSYIPTKERSIRSFKPQKDAFFNIETAIIELSKRIYEDIQKAKRLEKERKKAEEKFILQQQRQIDLQRQKDFQSRIIIFAIFIAIFLIGKSITTSNITKCSPEIKAEIYLQRGDEEEKGYNLQKAIEEYTCAIDSRSNYYEAYAKRGKIYLRNYDYELAISDFNRALEDNKDNNLSLKEFVFYLHLRGEANRRIWEKTQSDENMKKALKDYDYGISLNREDPYPYYGRAELYMAIGDKQQALINLERALFYFERDSNEKSNVKMVRDKIQKLKPK